MMENCKTKDIEKSQSIKDILQELLLLEPVGIEDSPEKQEYYRKLDLLMNNLREYYDTKGRHRYSEVSAFIYEKVDDQDLDYLYNNIDELHKKFIEYDKEYSKNYSKKIVKLEDHIRLELLRFEQLKKEQNENAKKLLNTIHKETENYEKKFANLNDEYEKQKSNIDNLNDGYEKQKSNIDNLNDGYEKQKSNIDNLNNQIISIIGIFSAIVITFFGGINFIDGILNSIDKVSKYRLVLSISIVGVILFNTIFMLLNFIAKLTNKNIRSCRCLHKCEDGNKCDELCNNKRGSLKCIREKHPTVYLINNMFIVIIILICITYYLGK